MGIVIGSCMAKETSVANINSPVYPSNRGNPFASSDGREPLHLLRVGGSSYSSADHQQQRMARAHSGPVPYAYIHDTNHQLRGHHTRRVVHLGERFDQFVPLCLFQFFFSLWHRFLAQESPFSPLNTLASRIILNTLDNPIESRRSLQIHRM